MKRVRLKLRMRSVILIPSECKRPKEYMDLRHWWLHELRQLRAKRKYAGIGKKEVKIAQKELARLRKDYK